MISRWTSMYPTKNMVIAFIIIIIGIIFIFLSNYAQSYKAYLDSISSILLISGVWTILYDLYLKNDFLKIIKENMCILNDNINKFEHISNTGLIRIEGDANKFSYEDFIKKNKKIVILLNDGRTWISHNEYYFEDNDNEYTDISFIITHPRSEMICVLARKQRMTNKQLEDKISQFLSSIERINKNRHSKIKIYGHKLYNPNSIFLGDDEVILSSYLVARGRGSVPLYVYKNTGSSSYFEQVKKDIDALLSDEETEQLN